VRKKLSLEVQYMCGRDDLPEQADFARWAQATLAEMDQSAPANLVIRIVDEQESGDLNRTYRHKSGPTNVLSFAYDVPGEAGTQGDLVICAPVVQREAREQGKSEIAHWAHMTVHGVLHLHGYDHIDDDDAAVMEEIESRVLAKLGFDDPY
jgi:probable rRNA maturation factor